MRKQEEKLVLFVVWGPNLDTQLIPHITPLLLSIMEKKIAIKGNNSKYIAARTMVLVYCTHPHLVMYFLFGLWLNVPVI